MLAWVFNSKTPEATSQCACHFSAILALDDGIRLEYSSSLEPASHSLSRVPIAQFF